MIKGVQSLSKIPVQAHSRCALQNWRFCSSDENGHPGTTFKANRHKDKRAYQALFMRNDACNMIPFLTAYKFTQVAKLIDLLRDKAMHSL
eukprot:1160328-Pelagomonas_calceolata.AAC.2